MLNTKREIITELKLRNPYPEDIFLPLNEEDKAIYVDVMIKNKLNVDRYSAALMRLGWNNCIILLEQLLEK